MNQICTNKSQSYRLLEAGVRPETADMYLDEFELPVAFEYRRIEGHVSQDMAFPAWSLSKLIEMLPATISQRNRPDLSLEITKDSVYWFIQYAELGYDCKHEVMEENVLDAVVNMIEWLIKEGYLDKKFLSVKCGDCKLIEDEDANGEAWCSFHQKPVRCYSKACEDILEKGAQNMREIKFRAKRIDNNKWAYGGLVQADDYCIIDQQNELYVEREYNFRGDTHFFQLSGVMCDETTIGQFTGLKDKSGKEIYEGDLIKAPSGRIYAVIFSTWKHEEKREFLKVIDLYEHTGWCISLDGVNPCDLLDSEVCRGSIIGNVYDNPELMEGGSND